MMKGISEPETPKDAGFYIYTGASELMAVADALREAGVNVKDAELIFKGKVLSLLALLVQEYKY
jgi:hypothetical protein